MAYDVFISYSTPDKPTADAACAVLEAKGIRCWIAPRDIALGADWTESIVSALEVCSVMVLIFSKHANESHQIKREVNIAADSGVTIIPMRMEDILPSKSLKYSIEITHWLDAFQPPLERHLEYLAQSIRGHLEALAKTGESPPELATTLTPLAEAMISGVAKLAAAPTQTVASAPAERPVSAPKADRSTLQLFFYGFLWSVGFCFAGWAIVLGIDIMLNSSNNIDNFAVGCIVLWPVIAIGLAVWLTLGGKLPGTRR